MGILRLNRLAGIALCLSASACSYLNTSYVPQFIKPYKVDIQQGNFVTEQETQRLQIGMTKDQVRFIMGTPLLNSPFHADRWDYVYRLNRADGSFAQFRYTCIFENDKLARHGGENLPTDQAEFLTGPSSGIKRPIAPISPAAKPESKPNTGGPQNQESPATPSGDGLSGTDKAPVLN
ncbi:outer membrane protein assembly factor BamE [Limnobacter humi]|uniref:Outer membrane protein assembly factor BamE n=1 Tax=Limnobacter humi TaxID=1778671 RepID=A0ABT1WHI9_9BURK|nr:outer membrane protein assembly factor BamE [Limnobacter humi]MCQ8896333.1 outer membrane protein assembly factor BamE [Limnobacter humi]